MTKIKIKRNGRNFETGKFIDRYGYKVQYEDGHLSWSPKHVFERCYRELSSQEIDMTSDY